MKTGIKQLSALAIFAIILLAGNVKAEGNKAILASSLETTEETSLQLENWMTNEAVWNTNTTAIIVNEADAELELENWMVDDTNWEVMPRLVQETDNKLELEQWMFNESNWKI